jgi:hypothetical protein
LTGRFLKLLIRVTVSCGKRAARSAQADGGFRVERRQARAVREDCARRAPLESSEGIPASAGLGSVRRDCAPWGGWAGRLHKRWQFRARLAGTFGSCRPGWCRAYESAGRCRGAVAERPASRVVAGSRPLLRDGVSQSVYVASILSRRVGLPGLMSDLDNTPLPGWMAFAGPDRGSGVGCVCHDPRLAGHVCHSPRTPAAGLRGTGATTPV